MNQPNGLPDVPPLLAHLSHLRLTAVQLTMLRAQRQANLVPLLVAERKRLRAFVRQLKHRKHRDTEIAERGVRRTIARYELNEANCNTWSPTYAKPEEDGSVSLDPEAIHYDGLEIRRFYHYPTLQLFVETFPSEPRPLLRRGRRLDGVVESWLITLYDNLCSWFPPKGSGRKTALNHALRLKRRPKVLSLTVEVANHYLPELKLTPGMLDKLIRPRLDDVRTAKARRKRRSQETARAILASVDRRSIAPHRQ